jgi:26S proteasome regulatory subunit T5
MEMDKFRCIFMTLFESGRLDRKIEFPHPTEEARARIMQIHSRKMNVSPVIDNPTLAFDVLCSYSNFLTFPELSIFLNCQVLTVDFQNVNFEELARCTDDFNGAQLKVKAAHQFFFCMILNFSMSGCLC